MSFDAKLFLKNVTTLPGVYQMLSDSGEILYIGKAKNLKNRLSSYFSGGNLSPKTQSLVAQIVDVKVIIAHSEYEALLIESNLIKEYLPRYNILLRDDKSYPYITLSKHEYPRLDSYRGAKQSQYHYFGPYPNGAAVRETLKLLQKLFYLRPCRDQFFKLRTRACLQYQIGWCSAPCVGKISREDYSAQVRLATLFLEGRSDEVVAQLIAEMDKASIELRYEEAARLRDLVAHLRDVQATQYVDKGNSDTDIFSIVEYQRKIGIGVQQIRRGQLVFSQGYQPKVPGDDDLSTILSSFVSQYYFGGYASVSSPKDIVTNIVLNDEAWIASALKEKFNRSVVVKTSVRGQRAKWLEMAAEVARHRLKQSQKSHSNELERWRVLQSVLGLPEESNRMECFDISHTMGEATVASCVVFENGVPVKSKYRRFNIKGITPGDDYAAMEQAVMRRYSRLIREEAILPDLIIVDGGKGQLAKAQSILEELQLTETRLLGVAKGPSRKAGLEQLFLAGEHSPLSVGADSLALLLIQHIRDEAHRFAITGHRGRRKKARKVSTLEQIPGIGVKRRGALLKHFGGIQGLSKASVDDISKVEGVSEQLAREVFAYFHELP